MAPITNCLKKGEFAWSSTASKELIEFKKRMVRPYHVSPQFFQVFEVAYDASEIGIGRAHSQESHPIAYFSEKLNDIK